MGDGDRWSIVVPKDLDRFPLLNADGTLTWVADEAFNWLVTSIDKRRADALSTLSEDGFVEIAFNFDTDWQFLIKVLQINYRVTPEVVSHLRLFSQQAIKDLISGLMDMPLQSV